MILYKIPKQITFNVQRFNDFPHLAVNTTDYMKLRIRGLPADMDKFELWDWLRPFPGIQSSWVVLDKINQKSKRMAIVLVDSPADGKRIQQALDGMELEEGKLIKVEQVSIRVQ